MSDAIGILICMIFLVASCTEKGFTAKVNDKEYSLKIGHQSDKKEAK